MVETSSGGRTKQEWYGVESCMTSYGKRFQCAAKCRTGSREIRAEQSRQKFSEETDWTMMVD